MVFDVSVMGFLYVKGTQSMQNDHIRSKLTRTVLKFCTHCFFATTGKVTLDLYKRARNNNFFGWFSKQESDINAWNFTAIIWGRNVIGTTNIEHVKMAQTCWIHKSFLFENLVEGYHFHI